MKKYNMDSRTRFLAACNRETLDRPPIWVMRQAGRYLPEYRSLKENYDFITMVKTPDLATKVTLQPLKRFELDAAILFSDILVVPEAMGQPYAFRDGGGISMEFAINSKTQIEKLSSVEITNRLDYVGKAINQVKTELGAKKALIGFVGSPWTLATYMVEGGSSKNYANIKKLFYTEKIIFNKLLSKITDAIIKYVNLQIESGVDAIQIFDSWGGILNHTTYWNGSAKYISKIVKSVEGRVPIIVFSKGAHNWKTELLKIGADVLGLDWTYPIDRFYDSFNGSLAVQGNLDPALLNTDPKIVKKEAMHILDSMRDRNGFIFNLGHGILPNAKIECMEALVNTVINYSQSKQTKEDSR